MNILDAIIQDGKLDVQLPEDWPNGKSVEIRLKLEDSEQITEENWPTTREGIEALFDRLKTIGPLFESPEDEAKFHADIEEHGKWELASPSEAPRFD